MKYFTLFPLQGYWGKWAGGITAFSALVTGALVIGMKMTFLNDLIDPNLQEIWLTWLFALGLFILSFSKEKIDDERVQRIRYVALRGASMMGFMTTLFVFSPIIWQAGPDGTFQPDLEMPLSVLPFAILQCLTIPLLTFQIIFNLGLYQDGNWAYNDLGAEENLRKNPWLFVIFVAICACLLGMIVYGMLNN